MCSKHCLAGVVADKLLIKTVSDIMGDTNMDQLRNAEFKEAFDEFDTVSTEVKFPAGISYFYSGWQWHYLT